jgi:hypothetical protein
MSDLWPCYTRQNLTGENQMLRFLTTAAAIALVMAMSTASVEAADQTTEVKFEPGATSATINGSLEGYDTNNFLLGATAGQVLKVTFKPANRSCYVNVNAPDSDEALFNGSIAGDDFSGTLPVDGNYQAMVYLMRNAARRNETCEYTITFEIDG